MSETTSEVARCFVRLTARILSGCYSFNGLLPDKILELCSEHLPSKVYDGIRRSGIVQRLPLAGGKHYPTVDTVLLLQAAYAATGNYNHYWEGDWE